MTIQEINPMDHTKAIECLGRLHWEETERHLFPEGPKIAWQMYQQMHEGGYLIALGSFAETELVGYCSVVLNIHWHYSILVAMHDTLFLRKDKRKGRIGLELLKVAESKAREKGARFIAWHAKCDMEFQQILIKLGYRQEDTIFSKEL